MNDIRLREVVDADLPLFFEHQLDEVANRQAAFTAKDPADRAAFFAKWTRIRADPNVDIRTVLEGGEVAGSILSYVEDEKRNVSYWIARERWGRGIATRALAAYLKECTARPLYASVAKDNVVSLRVLRKYGFEVTGEDRAFANARGEEIVEVFLKLAAGDDAAAGAPGESSP